VNNFDLAINLKTAKPL